MAGVCCGLAVGTKPIFWIYAALFAVVCGASALRGGRGRFMYAGVLAAGLTLSSLFWFVRSAQATGNPFYPLRVQIAGKTLLPGYAAEQITSADYDRMFVRSDQEWAVYPWVEWKRTTGRSGIPYGVDSGLGGAFAALIPLGLLVSIWRAVQGRVSRLEAVFLASANLLFVVWWFGLRRMPRFALPIVALACILATPFIARLLAAFPRATSALLATAVGATVGIASFVDLNDFGARWRFGAVSRRAFYTYPEAIDRLPPGARIANWKGLHNNFALAGRDLRNQVIPDFEVPDALTLEWLRKRKVEYVVFTATRAGEEPSPDVPELKLVLDQIVYSCERTARHWRIWRFEDANK